MEKNCLMRARNNFVYQHRYYGQLFSFKIFWISTVLRINYIKANAKPSQYQIEINDLNFPSLYRKVCKDQREVNKKLEL